MPPGRALSVRSTDGTRLHVEVFGPDDGYPVVLSHGITCALRVWTHQIADLATDHRVIAFDHRGHGRSDVPRRGGYTLAHVAADLNAVLDATLKPGERALLAGHSMGGVAIVSWADRYRDAVRRRADAVALINSVTGDLLQELQVAQVPAVLAGTRVRIAQGVIRAVGSRPVPWGTHWTSRRFVAAMAVGADADPSVGDFIYRLFAATPPAARGGCARMLADALGSVHLKLDGLTVPTLVIGSEKDRLLPIGHSRKIAEAAPNLIEFVRLSGGHCSILERPAEVNRRLRNLVALATEERRASS
ncbi:MAG: alpha/beta fold hydrolase [Mycobacteriaceae bacterium]|nr:alpha/beta fold hydrolase [Mycobacteriaceae bacterium]MBV9639555.1 alpha/beta fold hydrolase [Mycobacteriaceae bacterium]